MTPSNEVSTQCRPCPTDSNGEVVTSVKKSRFKLTRSCTTRRWSLALLKKEKGREFLNSWLLFTSRVRVICFKKWTLLSKFSKSRWLVLLTHGRMPVITWRVFTTVLLARDPALSAPRALASAAWPFEGFLPVCLGLRIWCGRRRSSFSSSLSLASVAR